MKKAHQSSSELSTLDKAKKLREFGFNVRLTSKRQSPQLKAATSRLFNQHAHFLNPKADTSPSKYFPLSKAKRRVAAKTLSSKSLTPKGFWLQVPRGVRPSQYSVSVTKGGIREHIPGRQSDLILPLSARDIANDPVTAFKKAIARATKGKGKKPKQAQLIVNGFQGKRVQSLKSMLYYLEHSPRFLEESGELDEEQFADTFQLKLIYGSTRSTKTRKSQKTKGRRR